MFTFKIIEKIMDPETRVKINMLKEKNFGKMFENNAISPDELTQEYGGNKVDPESYWPPIMMKLPDSAYESSEQNIFVDMNSQEQESIIKENKDEPIIFPQRKPILKKIGICEKYF